MQQGRAKMHRKLTLTVDLCLKAIGRWRTVSGQRLWAPAMPTWACPGPRNSWSHAGSPRDNPEKHQVPLGAVPPEVLEETVQG